MDTIHIPILMAITRTLTVIMALGCGVRVTGVTEGAITVIGAQVTGGMVDIIMVTGDTEGITDNIFLGQRTYHVFVCGLKKK